ncbi:MAG: glycosyltransferase [Verrucomicrobiota bacterium]|jgi:glycosyltransferase involved in cell wall biosynthesis
MLPISILIPTRHCAALVPGHLESLRAWLDLAEEVVVVDSDSRDGTVELLRAGLSHPCVKFLTHPPGLYESWNFGIQNTGSKYVYIATVGDSITRQGMEHLFEVAENFQSDIVLSKQDFVSADGEALPDDRWMIDVILSRLQIERPRLLSTTEQFLFAVTNLWGAILGSSASNLYRADCLKQRPFPTEYGKAGDGAWGILNIFEVKIAVTPERFSTFLVHEKAYAAAEYYVESVALKLFRLVQSVVALQGPRNPAVPRILGEIQWSELEAALEVVHAQQAKLEHRRQQKMPWLLNPGAWQARAARNKARRRISQITEDVVGASRASGSRPRDRG